MADPGDKTGGAKVRKASVFEKPVDLDDILVRELGQFGWYQIRNILLVGIAIMSSGFFSEYIFSAAAVPHRCRIPECGEYTKLHPYDPGWITNAIPETNSGLASCERYVSRNTGVNGTLDVCPANLFDSANTVGCDGFVYARDNSVVYDFECLPHPHLLVIMAVKTLAKYRDLNKTKNTFDLGCQEWLRALSGTLNSVGTLLVLPITGFISDRFGRKIALVISVFNMALFGLIRAFSVNYTMYMIMQIVQTTFGAGILTAELVGPQYRVLTGAIQSSMFASGQVLLGAVAWVIQPWRYMIIALHIPCFLMISYYWILPESVRWLISKHKFVEARKIIKNVAELNKTKISDKSMEALMNPTIIPKTEVEEPSLVKSIIRSPVLLRRVCTTPIWWITTIFVYYGLSINSTSLSDTIYLNYILTCAIEIPGFFTAALVLDKIGRKATLIIGFFLSAACNIGFIFIPSDLSVTRLVIFLLGKFGIAVVVNSLYLYTSELYPTEYRHSLLAFSSMIGRLGSITAPLTTVLANYWHGTPSALFGGMAVLSGFLVLTQPETLGTRMPDNLAEAEAIGRSESKLKIDS